MAGVTVPTVLMVFSLASFCVVRFNYDFPFPIERGMVFPLALVPPIWGLWNMLYVALRRRGYLFPLGLHGAVFPLLVGPFESATVRAFGFDIPRSGPAVFLFGVVIAMVFNYLLWKYLVGFFNELAGIGS
jgi:hypothetical protein